MLPNKFGTLISCFMLSDLHRNKPHPTKQIWFAMFLSNISKNFTSKS
jgi:hypothetical protein